MSAKIVNLELLSKTVNGNKAVIISVIDVFIEELPKDITELNSAVSSGDFVTINRQCHKMRSSVSIMGINEMVCLLEEIEDLGSKAEGIEQIRNLSLQFNNMINRVMQEVQEEKQKLL
jgi:HPt (histidine-containing phosphotransfer) domain-containing protein